MRRSTATNTRKCVACRKRTNKYDLIRICKYKSEIFIDESGKSEGRGAYICKAQDCIMKAIQTRALNRALKSQIDKEITNVLCSIARRINEQNEIT